MVVRPGIKPAYVSLVDKCGHIKYAVYVETPFLNLKLLHDGRAGYPHTTAVEMKLHNEFDK